MLHTFILWASRLSLFVNWSMLFVQISSENWTKRICLLVVIAGFWSLSIDLNLIKHCMKYHIQYKINLNALTQAELNQAIRPLVFYTFTDCIGWNGSANMYMYMLFCTHFPVLEVYMEIPKFKIYMESFNDWSILMVPIDISLNRWLYWKVFGT